jgi:hypothetical protein
MSNPSVRRQPSRKSLATRLKWQQHLEAQQASGWLQSVYCREHGLNEKYFSLWKRKLRRLESMVEFDQLPPVVKEPHAPTFIPVVVKSSPSTYSSPAAEVPTSSSLMMDTGLTFKAVLRNGVAIEVQMGSVSGVMPLLSQLAQLPC